MRRLGICGLLASLLFAGLGTFAGPALADPTNIVISAGSAAPGRIGDAIALNASVDDPDATPTLLWTADGPNCTFADATLAVTTITCTSAGNFNATITATDGINPPTSDTVQVSVLPHVTTVNAGPDVGGRTGQAIALNGSVVDPDSASTLLWTANDPSCTFADATVAATTITCTAFGPIVATLSADDGFNPPTSDSANVTVLPTPAVVNAGPDVSVDVGNDLQLTGDVTTGSIVPTIRWTIDGGCTLTGAENLTPIVNCLTAGIHTATLTAYDRFNPPVSDTAQVTVTIPPGLHVSAGPDVVGSWNAPITLNGLVTDSDATPTLLWTTDGPDCTFADATAAVTTITCTSVGDYNATLTATDGINPDASDTAVVSAGTAFSVNVNAKTYGNFDANATYGDLGFGGTNPGNLDNEPCFKFALDSASNLWLSNTTSGNLRNDAGGVVYVNVDSQFNPLPSCTLMTTPIQTSGKTLSGIGSVTFSNVSQAITLDRGMLLDSSTAYKLVHPAGATVAVTPDPTQTFTRTAISTTEDLVVIANTVPLWSKAKIDNLNPPATCELRESTTTPTAGTWAGTGTYTQTYRICAQQAGQNVIRGGSSASR